MSAPPGTSASAAPAPAASAAAPAPSVAGSILYYIKHPLTWVSVSFAAYCLTFGLVFYSSGVNLNFIDTSKLNIWWLGTILTSVLFLLLFFLVFHLTEYFNKSVIFLLLTTFLIVHVSLLLTQINLKVK
jgi:hypothetical protein